jgi:hypothetical protein
MTSGPLQPAPGRVLTPPPLHGERMPLCVVRPTANIANIANMPRSTRANCQWLTLPPASYKLVKRLHLAGWCQHAETGTQLRHIVQLKSVPWHGTHHAVQLQSVPWHSTGHTVCSGRLSLFWISFSGLKCHFANPHSVSCIVSPIIRTVSWHHSLFKVFYSSFLKCCIS